MEKLEQRVLLTAAPVYNFQNVNIGAGGYVDGVFYSPTQQNVIYARTDIGGLYKTTNDGTTWNQLLDFVGNNTTTSGNGTQQQFLGVLGFAMDPEHPNNLYADVGEYAGSDGAVFYSTNAGATWGQTNLSFSVGGNSNGRGDGEQIAVDPNDSNIVYLGSNSAGLWKSTNAGHSFTQISPAAFSPTSTTFVLFDPATGSPGSPTQTIYVGINSTSSGTNLFCTTNGGATWSQVTGTGNLPSGFLPGHVQLANGQLYLGYANAEAPNGSITNGGVYRLTTATNVWDNISPIVPSTTYSVTNLSRVGNVATATTSIPNNLVMGDYVTIAGAFPTAYDTTFQITSIMSPTTFTYTPLSSGTDTASGTITATFTLGFGYDGVAVDPENPNTVVVASFDYYSGPDQMWRTVDANSATPTWTEIYDFSTAQDSGYTGFDTTRDTNNAPYIAEFGDGISNWAGAIAINPFNSDQLMYGTGQGIWATNMLSNGGTNTQLTANDSWYFPDTGIEFTAVGGLATASSGVPLFSAMGDIFGFAQTTIAQSPAQGAAAGGSANAVDVGGGVIAIVGSTGTTNGVYSTNDGATFHLFPTAPPNAGTNFGQDFIAVSANGATMVWSPSGDAPYYSTNDGTTWTASAGGMPVDGQIIADQVNPNDFYYHSGSSLYFSSNGGVSFTLQDSNAPSFGQIAANPLVAGDIWLATSSGIFHSSNFGESFTHVGAAITSTNSVITLGAPAPGETVPAVYVFGTANNFLGVYRSDDGGTTFELINSTANQWGGLVQTIAADPNVFGRIYIGINGRGIIMGNPSDNVPTNWTDTDLSTPGNPGWAVTSTKLSNNTVNTAWLVNGGGGGLAGNSFTITSLSRTAGTLGTIATATTSVPNNLHIGDLLTISGASPSDYDGTFAVTSIVNSTTFTFVPPSGTDNATGTITATTSDQFNFAAEPISGDAAVTAQLLGLTNGDGSNGIPQAGVMFRASESNNGDPFVALVQSTDGTLSLETRATSGGSVTITALGGIPVGSEYFQLLRTGDSFGAFYSPDGKTWTQFGSNVMIAAMPDTADAGVAVTSNFNSQLSSAQFAQVAVTLPPPPQITSTTSAMFFANSSQSFTFTASDPGQTISFSDNSAILPAGLSFTDNGDGTATLAGTPGQFSGGTFKLTITAANASSSTSQTFTFTVFQAAAITTPATTTFTVGKLGTFNMSASAFPAPAMIIESGSLPAGLTLTTTGAHTAQLHGTPASGTGGTYAIQLYALNAIGPITPQSFTLVIDRLPAFSSPAQATFITGNAQSFTVITTGGVGPAPMTLSSSATVPGLTFADNGDGTATFSGQALSGGTYKLTLTASNGLTPVTQTFLLTVDRPPKFNTGAGATFTAGTLGTFNINVNDYPAATTFLETGLLPPGVTLTTTGVQSAELHGIPTASAGGTYNITLYAHNGVAPVAAQNFTLIVDAAPFFTSPAQTTMLANATSTFTFTTTGVGTLTSYTEFGTTPPGLNFTDNGDGTASLAGVPAGTGIFKFTVTAANGTTPTKQIFTLTVQSPASISSANTTTFFTGHLTTFNLTASAFPATTAFFEIGALPAGVTLVPLGTTSAQLRGTPASAAAGTYTLTLLANNGLSPLGQQVFTLIIATPVG